MPTLFFSDLPSHAPSVCLSSAWLLFRGRPSELSCLLAWGSGSGSHLPGVLVFVSNACTSG